MLKYGNRMGVVNLNTILAEYQAHYKPDDDHGQKAPPQPTNPDQLAQTVADKLAKIPSPEDSSKQSDFEVLQRRSDKSNEFHENRILVSLRTQRSKHISVPSLNLQEEEG